MMRLRRNVQSFFLLAASFAATAGLALAQNIPAATQTRPSIGFEFPTASGTLHYGISLAERAAVGYDGQNDTSWSTSISGNLGYLSGSVTHPFSLLYSAGYIGVSNGGEPSSQFHNLALSQVLSFGKWSAVLSDSIDYLPQASTLGLSGIAGVGDANLPPGQLIPILDANTLNRNISHIGNTAAATVSRQITGKTGVSGSASMRIDRYLGADSASAIDDNSYSLSGALNHTINARTGTGLSYSFLHYNYLGQNLSSESQSVSVYVNRRLTRRFSGNVSIGPQRTTGSNSLIIPTRLSYTGSAGLSYEGKQFAAALGYGRGITGGAGVVTGALTDSVVASAQRRFGQVLFASANIGYIKSQSLSNLLTDYLNTKAVVGGVQVNRSLGRSFSAFASYTAQQQVGNGPIVSNILFNGLAQTIGFGVTYSPESIHIGRP